MKAVAYTRSLPITDPTSLIDLDLPDPPPPTGRDLLVRVRAVSVNPVDTKIRRRNDPQGAPELLGWDAAGIVAAAGPEARLFHPGDQVFYAGAINRPGCNAELHLVDERIVGPKPACLSFEEAAALPLTSLTAYELMFHRMGIPRDPTSRGTVLIVGAGGGVGSIATQLARAMTGLVVIGTASRPKSRDWVRAMGAHHVVDHTGDLVAQVKALAPGGVDGVLSLTATAQHFPALVELCAPQARIGVIDDPDGPLDIALMKRKSLSLHWEFMFTRSLYDTPDIERQHRVLTSIATLVEAGRLRSTLTRILGPLDAATLRQAHEMLESGRTVGKLVLTVGSALDHFP